jgi:hypothetical protein
VSYESFESFIRHPAPGFACRPAGRGRESERFTVRVAHEVRPPATAADLASLGRLIPAGAEQILAFYAVHDGFILYRDTRILKMGAYSIQAAGVELYRVEEMERNTTQMRKSLATLPDKQDTNGLKTSVAIGGSPHSGNYFAMTVRGPQAGKVFFVDHDDWRQEAFADSFEQFLELICTSPALLLAKTLGCTARYSDGETNSQWIPIEYLENAASS